MGSFSFRVEFDQSSTKPKYREVIDSNLQDFNNLFILLFGGYGVVHQGTTA